MTRVDPLIPAHTFFRGPISMSANRPAHRCTTRKQINKRDKDDLLLTVMNYLSKQFQVSAIWFSCKQNTLKLEPNGRLEGSTVMTAWWLRFQEVGDLIGPEPRELTHTFSLNNTAAPPDWPWKHDSVFSLCSRHCWDNVISWHGV